VGWRAQSGVLSLLSANDAHRASGQRVAGEEGSSKLATEHREAEEVRRVDGDGEEVRRCTCVGVATLDEDDTGGGRSSSGGEDEGNDGEEEKHRW
jgi:hypothetical protein